MGHGVAREGTRNGGGPPTLINTTSYPVDLSLGSTWNPGLVYREASMISDETREIFRQNKLDLSHYSPTINLARDPRWGRNDEAFSEDPLLTTALASQFVNGLQGQTEQGRPLPESGGYLKTIATLKHFAANNSEFNRVNEIPAPASVQLHDTLARQTFGFGGYFTSDCDAVYEIQAGHHWQPANASAPLDEFGRTAYAQSAGEDLNCNAGYKDGKNYAEDQVPWVAAARQRLAPGTWTNSDANDAITETPERLAMAREVAAESIVLLQNKPPVLPLRVPKSGGYRIAVLGSYANPASMFLGGYSSIQGAAGIARPVTAYAGLTAAVRAINPGATVDFLPGTVPGDLGTVDAVVSVAGTPLPTPEVVTARPVVAGDAAAGISQRVSFPAGSRIDPQLTVSLSDESLAGYQTLGTSTPLPYGMRVRYESNRPDVVSAGPDGVIARQPGVATVTATVHYRGGTAQGTFVVLVPAPPA